MKIVDEYFNVYNEEDINTDIVNNINKTFFVFIKERFMYLFSSCSCLHSAVVAFFKNPPFVIFHYFLRNKNQSSLLFLCGLHVYVDAHVITVIFNNCIIPHCGRFFFSFLSLTLIG